MKKISLILVTMFLAGAGMVFAQEGKKDPYVVDPSASEADLYPDAERSIGILVEYIKLDHLKANELLRVHAPNGADAQGLRDELGELIKEGTAELLETTWIHARSGQRAKTESVNEMIYPTEWLPATAFKNDREASKKKRSVEPSETKSDVEIPANESEADIVDDEKEAEPPNLIPTDFQTRHVGVTLEIDPVIGADNKTIDLNLAPEIVYHMGDKYLVREGHEESAKGLEHVSMPSFYTMKVTTQVTAIDGKYVLLTILTPQKVNERVIVLLRPDIIIVK